MGTYRIHGLERTFGLQQEELARHLAAKVYASVAEVFEATGTFWENYAPDLVAYGMPSKKTFVAGRLWCLWRFIGSTLFRGER